MTTIIHNKPDRDHYKEERGGGAGFLLGVVLLVILVGLFLVYGLPVVRNSLRSNGIQINVPEKVQVDVDDTQNPPPTQ